MQDGNSIIVSTTSIFSNNNNIPNYKEIKKSKSKIIADKGKKKILYIKFLLINKH